MTAGSALSRGRPGSASGTEPGVGRSWSRAAGVVTGKGIAGVRGVTRAPQVKDTSGFTLSPGSLRGDVPVASSCRPGGPREESPDQGGPPKRKPSYKPEAGQAAGLPGAVAGVEGKALPV